MADQTLESRSTLALSDIAAGDLLLVWDESANSTKKMDAQGALAFVLPTGEDFTADDTLTSAESGKLCTNVGASGTVQLTLPTATGSRDVFGFLRYENQELRLKPSGSEIILGGGAGKYAALLTYGVLALQDFAAGVWVPIYGTADWNFEP